ncbi:MAG: cobalamin B12-binding domain-containing protein, partial [Deltaproteobacteria bacterium]|nr:cobalamin B12-binding domain-containing protein [Deltaproteobacteria bacterium]
ANACKAGASVLVEEIRKAGGDWKPVGTLVIGTVSGDIHDIGKTLVATLFEASGFNVVDLGVNIEPEGFVEAVRNHRPDVLGLSSLLTTTMGEQKIVIEALERESLRAAVKVLVGGGAVSRDWAREIGADGFGENAQEAVCAAKALLGLS